MFGHGIGVARCCLASPCPAPASRCCSTSA